MHEVFQKRHSVRSFQTKAVIPQLLKEILQAAHSAPSAGNLKAREIVVVQDSDLKRKLAEAAFDQEFISEAPVVLVFFSVPSRSAVKYGNRGKDLYSLQDATIAASFAWLEAVMLGIDGCWVGAFDEEEVKEIFRVRDDWRPIAILPFGYQGDN